MIQIPSDQGTPSIITRGVPPTEIWIMEKKKTNKEKHSKKFFNWLLMVVIYKNTDKCVEHRLLPSLWCHKHGTVSVTLCKCSIPRLYLVPTFYILLVTDNTNIYAEIILVWSNALQHWALSIPKSRCSTPPRVNNTDFEWAWHRCEESV